MKWVSSEDTRTASGFKTRASRDRICIQPNGSALRGLRDCCISSISSAAAASDFQQCILTRSTASIFQVFSSRTFPRVCSRRETDIVTSTDVLTVEVAMLPDAVDKTQQCWVDLMTLMKATNETFFSSKDQTARLVQSGEFVRHLDEMQPMLQSWYQGFKSLEVSRYARIILSIEYHYINLYINALALQAVLEQWTTKAQAKTAAEGPASPASSVASSFTTYHGKNEPYIKEVIDSSRTVLRHVVEDLLPTDYLKHAPVRTFFRIVSATMFLLKVGLHPSHPLHPRLQHRY